MQTERIRAAEPAGPSTIASDRDVRTSSLPLLVPRIRAHDEHHTTTAHDLALLAHAADAGADLHDVLVGGAARLVTETTQGKGRIRAPNGIPEPTPITRGWASGRGTGRFQRLAGCGGRSQDDRPRIRDRDGVLEMGARLAVHGRLGPVVREYPHLFEPMLTIGSTAITSPGSISKS